ncbi:hypothetical protein GGX14DRAFT_620187 [Mycena pura]|uniref:Uncharacterized protein n=1 Tax=Mycena pura TaxID=153505 RepID=A0AAD6YEX8_9AGAR|nr:hypothetical protein GGX14DRAFT_620187 [Mycena pura]
MATTAGAWEPPPPGTTTTPPSQRPPFSPGYTYGDIAFSNVASNKSTAPYSNKSASNSAPAFVLYDPDLISDLAQWFEVMMNSSPDGNSPTSVNPIIRFRLTPPACAHCWDAIVTHAMAPCRNEGWVESYATNIISLISCLIQGIWPHVRLAEWPVEPVHSQQGDRHITVATIIEYPNRSRALAGLSAIAGEWKTDTVLMNHLTPMLTDHVLPSGVAENGDAILKKLGLHILTTDDQCQNHNQNLARHPNIPAAVNVHYGIVFTGQTCLVSQLGSRPPLVPQSTELIISPSVSGPTPPNYLAFPGLAVASILIAPDPNSQEATTSFVGLMLGMIWAQRRVRVTRDLAGQHAGQVDRMYDDYLGIYPSLQHRLKKRRGTPGMPNLPPPPPPPGPPGPPGPPAGGMGYGRPRRNAPGGSFPSGSTGAGGFAGMGRTYYQPTNSQYGSGYSLQQMERMLLRYAFSAGRLVPLGGTSESRAYLAVCRQPSSILAALSAPLNFKITALAESFSIVALFVSVPALSNARASRTPIIDGTGSVATVYRGKLATQGLVDEYTFVIQEADMCAALANLTTIISVLVTVIQAQSQSSAGLLLNVTVLNPLSMNRTSGDVWGDRFKHLPHGAVNQVD